MDCNSSVAPNLGSHRTARQPPKRHEVSQVSFIHLPYAIKMAYIEPQRKEESKAFRESLYHTLHAMAAKELKELRIMLLHPPTDWPKVWHNLHTAPIREEMKSVWFTVIHDIIPRNERLAKIHLRDTTLCKYCGPPDTLQYRITDCNEGTDIWR